MACDLQDLSRSLPMSAGASNISIRSQATIEAGVQAQITVKKIVTELQGVHFGIKAAPKPLFAARRLLLEEGELDLGAHTFSIARIGLSEGHLDVGLDRQGKINWQQLLTLKGTGAAQEKPQAATAAAQSTAANPAPAKEAPWKIDVGSVDIKDMAFGLVDLSRSVPVTAGIAAISIGLKANVEAGNELQVAVKEISTELKGLQLGTTGSPKALFEAQKFLLEGGDVDLGAKTLKVARINVSDGYFDVARDRDGKINWTELFAAKDNPSVQTEPQPASGQPSQWKFLLKSFELDNFRSEVMDQTAHAEKPLFQLQDLQVRISEIDGKSPMDLQVGFGLQQGGKVALRGKVDPASPSVEANINLAGVDLALAQPYIEPFITLTLDSAALSLDGVLRYGTPAKGPKISYEGSFGIDRLSLNQPGSKETYLGWDALQIPKMKVELERNRLQVDEITISQPVGQLIIAEDGSVNLAKILKEQPDTGRKTEPTKPQSKGAARKGSRRSAAKPAESGDSFPFSIGKVKIKDGNMVFADLSLTPKFMTRIHALKGTVGKLSSEKRTLSQVKLDGRVDQYGMVKISGTLDVNDFKRTTDITMAFRNVEMANISPYSGRFAGRRIKSGKLSLDLKYNIKNNKLAGDNKIIVDNLVLGEKVESPDAMNLPLDLAIALLSDSNGRIDLGLPVSGELNDPQFSIGAIIWKTLANIIVKAATAPFRALGSLLGGGAEKFDAVEFEPGKAELLPPEKEKLKKVAEALQKRPQLRLVVHGQYSPELDGLELKRLFVSRAVDARMGVQPKADDDLEPLDFSDSKVRDALEKLYTERFGPKALDEIKRAVKEGEIKPREDAGDKQKARKKGKGLGRLWTSMKLYKIVPGAMSPEQSELLAVELFARLVESDPNPEQALAQLADDRARAITAELESANAVPADRLQIGDVQPFAQEAGLSAKLSLDAVAAAN
ncbi:MAG: DUF748 domain-containing protein, partial [Desulforhabdus sp.]|jgi:uncharacterized protein involved in outer membrane biogenesis|nr:DUF748 domain-containing protein [Desulforhabdus sp.]